DDWIAKLHQHFETPPGYTQPALDGLVRVGHAAHTERLWLPTPGRQLVAQKLWSILLDQDFGLEVQTCGKTQVFVRRPRVTVNAAMLTAAVRIDTGREADVRAVVVRNDGARRVLQELRRRRDRLGFCFVPLPLVMKTLEAIGRIRSCAAAANGTVTTIHADVRSDWSFSAGIGRTAN